jgi:hypothetical protein
MFDAPVPGESLTIAPGNAPWEQPPQFAKIEEALAFYLKKFQDDEMLEEALFLIEEDMPIELLVNSMLMYGEMQGKHTPDMSILIGPIIHEYLKSMADAAEIKYREFQGKTSEEKKKDKEKNTLKILLGKGLNGPKEENPPMPEMAPPTRMK